MVCEESAILAPSGSSSSSWQLLAGHTSCCCTAFLSALLRLLLHPLRYQPSIAAGDWWRLFSSICIHGSFSHLFSNMIALVILAVPLEHTYGPLRIFAIFLSAGAQHTALTLS
jgi:membrane associated rhomboid family serine protease